MPDSDPTVYSTPRITMTQTITRGASDVDVIAALRLAVEATDDWDKLGQVAKAILEAGRETPEDNTGGLELLLRLHREGVLKFEVGDA